MTKKLPSNLDDFAAIILTHGRPDRVLTYETIRRQGYTGRIVILIDDLDKTRDQYIEKYGDQVYIFDKRAVKKQSEAGNNFNDLRSTIYPRNAMFDVAKDLGLKYFIQLDDDYNRFCYKFDNRFDYDKSSSKIYSLDKILLSMLRFHIVSGAQSTCMAQGGDFIGGQAGWFGEKVRVKRKGMNSFICSVDRPFKFFGQMNEDVNTVVKLGSMGKLFFTTNQIMLCQAQTQSTAGGMTEIYLDSGTYVKTFYTIMYHPSSVRVSIMKDRNEGRIHHRINWAKTAPKILRESLRK